MIRAVAYCAEWDHDRNAFTLAHPEELPPTPPTELVEWWDFLRYRLPPNAGGLRDQPLGWMRHGETLDSAYRAWRAWLASDKGPEWRREHPRETAIALQVREIVYG